MMEVNKSSRKENSCSEKTIASLLYGLERVVVSWGFSSWFGDSAPIRDLPPIGFCNDWLLGSKYAACQENLTKPWSRNLDKNPLIGDAT
jgi:hypothetical protein